MKTEMEIKLKQEIKRAFSYNLKYWLNKRNLKQIDLVNRLHLSKSTVSQWLNPNSRKMPSTTTLNKIAEILDVDLSDLLEDNVASFKFSDVENIAPLPRTKRRPRLGVIACGEPILAQENIEDYDDVPEDMQCDFTLICQGDSMTGARINEGRL